MKNKLIIFGTGNHYLNTQVIQINPGPELVIKQKGDKMKKVIIIAFAMILNLSLISYASAACISWSCSPYNWENNSSNWKNSSTNWDNSPSNWKNSSSNWNRSNGIYNNNGNSFGYVSNGNIFDDSGNRLGYFD